MGIHAAPRAEPGGVLCRVGPGRGVAGSCADVLVGCKFSAVAGSMLVGSTGGIPVTRIAAARVSWEMAGNSINSSEIGGTSVVVGGGIVSARLVARALAVPTAEVKMAAGAGFDGLAAAQP